MLPLRAGYSAIRVILLDIEGTTTPVDFVYKTLFPYASRKLETYLREHHQDPETESLIAQLRAQHQVDAEAGLGPPEWAMQSGEEYELLFTAPQRHKKKLSAMQGITIIGEVKKGRGVWAITRQGKRTKLSSTGYTHF